MKFNALIPEFDIEDLAASLEFYVDLLGFEIAYQRPEEGFAFLEKGEAQLMLDTGRLGRRFVDAPPGSKGKGVNLQIMVVDLDQMIAALTSVRVPFVLPFEDKWYRINDGEICQRQCVVADPDGYLLRLCQNLTMRELS